MKFTLKPKLEATEQLNLRIPLSSKQLVDRVRAHADRKGVDYNGTLIGVIDQFNVELEQRLQQIDQESEVRSASGAAPVAEPADVLNQGPNGRKLAS